MSRFTLTELFGMYVPMPELDDTWPVARECHRCGAAILKPDNHLRWHNLVEPRRWD